jgi:hypothetical protein
VPASGAPIERNFLIVYGGFALFWANASTSIASVGATPFTLFSVAICVAVPLVGDLAPSRVSLLLATRFHAGNSPHSIRLCRGDAHRKLARSKMRNASIYDPLARFYDRPTAVGLVGKDREGSGRIVKEVMGSRLMHLHGRALAELLPKAVDRLDEHDGRDGEIVAGVALGWNFGDGHLHHQPLLEAIRALCDFEEGELRRSFVEAQPMLVKRLEYRVADAKTARADAGEIDAQMLRARHTWNAPT